MVGRRFLLIATSAMYLGTFLAPERAAAQSTGALIGGIAGGMIGGMIAGSMARQGGYAYRRSYAAPRVTRRSSRVATSRARTPAPRGIPGGGTTAASIDSGKDPFAKAGSAPTTSASMK